jgi:hypothetical protein
MRTFNHSGATGDIVFSLPVVRDLGGGHYYISNFHQQRSESIAKLLTVQPYIESVTVGSADSYTHDLNQFRMAFTGAYDNIVEAHYRSQGIAVGNFKDGWLTLPDRPLMQGSYAVINRTERYQDANCNWSAELDILRANNDRVIFIGYEDEHRSFCSQFGEVEYMDVDFLDGAYLLQGCSTFSGNYSCWATIAQGLGITYRLEQAPAHTCSTFFVERETIINRINTWK